METPSQQRYKTEIVRCARPLADSNMAVSHFNKHRLPELGGHSQEYRDSLSSDIK